MVIVGGASLDCIKEQFTSGHRHIRGANADGHDAVPHQVEQPVLYSAWSEFVLDNEHLSLAGTFVVRAYLRERQAYIAARTMPGAGDFPLPTLPKVQARPNYPNKHCFRANLIRMEIDFRRATAVAE
jgi:hypothetical protein